MSNLASRVLVALVAIPLMVWITLEGSWPFAFLVALLSLLGVREFYALAATKAAQPQVLLGSIVAAAIPLCIHYDAHQTHALSLPLILVSVLLMMSIELWRQKPHPLINLAVQLSSFVYITLFLSCLVLLRDFDASSGQLYVSGLSAHSGWQGLLLLSTFITVWSGDSAAYFAGLAFGRHKIFPRVSPKKSWEGSIAGFLFSILAFHLSTHFLLPEFPVSHGYLLGALIGVVGPIGDFAESLLKRDAAIKDSSSLIPGHGGVLDRFDSILFVAPMMVVYLELMAR